MAVTPDLVDNMTRFFIEFPHYTNTEIARQTGTNDNTVRRYRERFEKKIAPYDKGYPFNRIDPVVSNPDTTITRSGIMGEDAWGMLSAVVSLFKNSKCYDVTILIKEVSQDD
jgi:hypothetical protein